MTLINQFYRFRALLLVIAMIYTLGSCKNCKDEYYYLPELAGRYYENNDTIVFYCEETDEYETYILCERRHGETWDEIYDGICGFWEYHEVNIYFFDRDSCNSNYELYIRYGARISGWDYIIDMRNPQIWESDRVYWGEEPTRNQEILGYYYENVTYSDFEHSDSVKSAVFSTEYGIVQFTYNDKTFSLLRK